MALVYESDAALEGGLREDMQAALRPLEEVPTEQQNWRPGTDNQVRLTALQRTGSSCKFY